MDTLERILVDKIEELEDENHELSDYVVALIDEKAALLKELEKAKAKPVREAVFSPDNGVAVFTVFKNKQPRYTIVGDEGSASEISKRLTEKYPDITIREI